MNRRDTISTLLGKTSVKKPTPKEAETYFTPPKKTGNRNAGLDPYTGTWDFDKAAHLLRRTYYGPTKNEIAAAVQNGLEATVQTLLADQPLPDPPVNPAFPDDPNVPIGETWVDKAYPGFDPVLFAYRRNSLSAWSNQVMLETKMSIREKMTLFWHNHFVTEMVVVQDPRYMYKYITTLRENALGNFRELTKFITVDPAMLRYLNGNQNAKQAPNENYARELLELFTVGKGALIGPGDYGTFTEDDVAACAKVLTGWRDRGYYDQQGNPVDSFFIPFLHDNTNKELSHHFGNAVIRNNGINEYADLIDVIFEQDTPAYFICRKLYRWFVYYEIDDVIENNVIAPMAQLLIANDYNVKPVLEALLKSEHFYEMNSIGPMIKNPLDFMVGVLNQFEYKVDFSLEQNYGIYQRMAGLAGVMQMQYLNPPSVAGWKAYYQEPSYYRQWINSVTLSIRMPITDVLSFGYYDPQLQAYIGFDFLAFILKLDNPLDPNDLIEESVRILFPQPITQNQHDYLKEALLPGLPDFEWTVEYGDYLNNPDDDDLKNAVENKLKNLFRTMLSMPEFYLS